jgi:hypothetical protein
MVARVEQLAELSPTCRLVYRRRVARAAAGAAATAGGAVMFAVALWYGVSNGIFSSAAFRGSRGLLTGVMWASWVAAAVAYVSARAWAAGRFDEQLSERLSLTGELFDDIVRVRNVTPRDVGVALARQCERWSTGLPLVGLALLAPLTLHYLFLTLVGGAWPRSVSFDEWIIMSAVIVGHCHLVLALKAWLYSRDLRAWEETELERAGSRAGWSAWKWTVVASAMPGLVLFGVPLFLVAVTGVFVPVSFAIVTARVRGERVALGACRTLM